VVTICTASLTLNNSTFCPQSVFMCFVWIWEQTAIISLYSINWLVFTRVRKIAKSDYLLQMCVRPSARLHGTTRLPQEGLSWNFMFEYFSKICGETFLLLPTWYTNFLFIYTNYIKLNSPTCFERIPPIIRRSTTQIVHMQPLVPSLSASACLVQPLRMDFLCGCTRQALAEGDDTRGCICTICVVDLLMMSGMRSKHVEEFNLMSFV